MRLVLLHIMFSGVLLSAVGQELNCQVSIIIDNKLEITSVERDVLDQLENTIYELMNNTKWTKDKFTVEERINCQLQLQIQEVPEPGTFKGMLQVQSSRPALNSSYNTTLFNFQDDDIQFGFSRNAILSYAKNQYRDNLTSILAFYAYFIIAMDYDSFGLKDGSKYFSMAQDVVLNAQVGGVPGWSSNQTGTKNNRYYLVDNALHELFEPLRQCNYSYHRNGVDGLYDDVENSRKEIYSALNKLRKVVSARPNSVNLINFVQAKRMELKNLYANAPVAEKNKIVTLLKRLDPASASRYQEILE